MGSIFAGTCFFPEPSMMRHSNARITTGIVIIVLLAIIQSEGLLVSGVNLYSSFTAEDANEVYEKRLEGLKSVLPSQGVIRYVTDDKFYKKRFKRDHPAFPRLNDFGEASDEWPENVFAGAGALQAYFLTQYTLAPLIVVNTIDCDLVVGDFYSEISIPEFSRHNHVILVKDFGNGVMLFRRESR